MEHLTAHLTSDLCSGEQDGGQLIYDLLQWTEHPFLSIAFHRQAGKLAKIIVWN